MLAKEEGRILVISKYALDCQRYNSERTAVTWEKSSLRSWLNETFMEEAFIGEEQSYILETKVTADRNPVYSTDSGNSTTDKAFLLSITEVERYFNSKKERKCEQTAYAKAKGASSSNRNSGRWWWLRSPGVNQDRAAIVNSDGDVSDYGGDVNDFCCAVRPALWINLES